MTRTDGGQGADGRLTGKDRRRRRGKSRANRGVWEDVLHLGRGGVGVGGFGTGGDEDCGKGTSDPEGGVGVEACRVDPDQEGTSRGPPVPVQDRGIEGDRGVPAERYSSGGEGRGFYLDLGDRDGGD